MKTVFTGVHHDGTKISVEGEPVSLTEQLELFENYLRGCGYFFGSIEAVDDEE